MVSRKTDGKTRLFDEMNFPRDRASLVTGNMQLHYRIVDFRLTLFSLESRSSLP